MNEECHPESGHPQDASASPTSASSPSELESAEQPLHPIRASWPALLLALCGPVSLVTYAAGDGLFKLAQGYLFLCMGIAPAQLIYGLVLESRGHPRAGLHLKSAVALGSLLGLVFLLAMQLTALL